MKKRTYLRIARYAIISSVPLLLFTWSCGSNPTAQASGNTPTITWQMPVEVYDTTQLDYAIFGWQSFIALNWPADTSYRGKPDTTKNINASNPTVPTVWETFRLKEETFLSGAANPGAWNDASINGTPRRSFRQKSMFRFAKSFDTIPTDPQGGTFNEAFVGAPLVDQDSNYTMYEIAINESEYTYVANHGYYNGNTQKAQIHDSTFVNPPKGDTLVQQSGDSLVYQIAPSIAGLPSFAQYGALEVKAAWRILPADTSKVKWSRYYHRPSVISMPNGGYQTAEVGLVGLHILRLSYITRNTWYWASFEQIDNVTVPSGVAFTPSYNPGGNVQYPNGFCSYPTNCDSIPAAVTDSLQSNPTPVNVSRYSPTPAYIDSLNTIYQAKLSNSVWKNYKMVGVVNQVVGTDRSWPVPYTTGVYANTGFMANTVMETYAQHTSNGFNNSNCVSCHGLGTPQFYSGDTQDSLYAYANSQIFTFLLGDATTPPSVSASTNAPAATDDKKKKPQ